MRPANRPTDQPAGSYPQAAAFSTFPWSDNLQRGDGTSQALLPRTRGAIQKFENYGEKKRTHRSFSLRSTGEPEERLLIFEYNFRVQLSSTTFGSHYTRIHSSYLNRESRKQRRFREGTKRTLDFTSKEGRLRWRRSLQCCPRPLQLVKDLELGPHTHTVKSSP